MFPPKDQQCTDIENAMDCLCNRIPCVCEYMDDHENGYCELYCPLCLEEKLNEEVENGKV